METVENKYLFIYLHIRNCLVTKDGFHIFGYLYYHILYLYIYHTYIYITISNYHIKLL